MTSPEDLVSNSIPCILGLLCVLPSDKPLQNSPKPCSFWFDLINLDLAPWSTPPTDPNKGMCSRFCLSIFPHSTLTSHSGPPRCAVYLQDLWVIYFSSSVLLQSLVKLWLTVQHHRVLPYKCSFNKLTTYINGIQGQACLLDKFLRFGFPRSNNYVYIYIYN